MANGHRGCLFRVTRDTEMTKHPPIISDKFKYVVAKGRQQSDGKGHRQTTHTLAEVPKELVYALLRVNLSLTLGCSKIITAKNAAEKKTALQSFPWGIGFLKQTLFILKSIIIM